MIIVQVGKLGRASIDGRHWSADDDRLRRTLQDRTDLLTFPGGCPDDEDFAVQELARELPLQVVERRDPPPDPEAINGVEPDGVVY